MPRETTSARSRVQKRLFPLSHQFGLAKAEKARFVDCGKCIGHAKVCIGSIYLIQLHASEVLGKCNVIRGFLTEVWRRED